MRAKRASLTASGDGESAGEKSREGWVYRNITKSHLQGLTAGTVSRRESRKPNREDRAQLSHVFQKAGDLTSSRLRMWPPQFRWRAAFELLCIEQHQCEFRNALDHPSVKSGLTMVATQVLNFRSQCVPGAILNI